MIKPAKLMKLKASWDRFSQNHPKFPMFLDSVHRNAIEEGTIIEIKVTTPSGKTINSNIKVTESDMELFDDLSGTFKS